MKLLILQDQLRSGGTERQSLHLAKACLEAGHDAEILVFRPGGHLAVQQHLESVQMKVLQPFNSGLSFWAPGLMKAVRQSNPDVILCMGRTANCYAGFVQRRFGTIPVVGTLRTGKTLFPLHHWSMGIVRAVLVNSNWWKRRLLERNFPEGRIHVVHNAVLLERNEEEHHNCREKLRERYQLSRETCLFLNVATFRPGKRHLDLLKIFAEVRQREPALDWRLWLVGDGKEYRRCRRWAAENGLGTRVRFFHFQQDPFPFYAASDVAVSASREDSLPNFLVEAQATGLPVLAYDCRGVKETCQPGETGEIIAAGEVHSFVQSAMAFARDPEHRGKFAAGAPEFARKRFSRGPQTKAILDFLEGLIIKD